MSQLVSDADYSRLVEAVKRNDPVEEIMHIVRFFQSGHWIEIENKFYAEVARDIQLNVARKLLWRVQEFGILPNYDQISGLFILNDRPDLLELLREFGWRFKLHTFVFIDSCIRWGGYEKLQKWIADRRFDCVV